MMNTVKKLVLAAGVTAALAGCSVFDKQIEGSGHQILETRHVQNFDTIELEGAGDVVVTRNGQEGVVVCADDNLMNYIKTRVEGTTLKIGPEEGYSLSSDLGLKYTVDAKTLSSCKLVGAGNIIVSNVASSSLDLSLTGAGNIVATGSTGSVYSTISGSGSIDTQNLYSTYARASITGSGTIRAWAVSTLNASISGTGTIYYYGAPAIIQNITGVGSVTWAGSK